MRAHDWSASPLGKPDQWPQALRTVIDLMLNSQFPMFAAWGPELAFLYNDGYRSVLGAKHPEALGRPFKEVWAEIWSDISPLIERALAGEATFHENLHLVMERNGYPEDTWYTFSYSPVRGGDGKIAGMFCSCVETTAQVLAERRQVKQTERLRQLFHNAPGFIAVLQGPEHIFEMVNESYLQLVGHRNLVGKTVREALPEVEGQGFYELLDRVYRSGEPFTGHDIRIGLQRTLGAPVEERLVDFVYQPTTDSEGRVTGIFAEGYDVTERHRAEQALRESEERFRLISDSAPVPMWVTKLDRKRGFVNRAYAEFLGLSHDEALDFDWRHIIHPDDAEHVVSESLAGEATLEPFALEARYRRCDGEWRWLRSVSQPRWGPDGEHAGFIGVAFDVTETKTAEAALRELNETLEARVVERTSDLSDALDRLQAEVGERVRAEEALRQAQKMEAVGQLTGGIAHDFNNLLTPILGGLEIIASRVDDARMKRIAETALESTRRGAKLTSQLLAFSRIQRISMAPVAVNGVIANMKDLLRHSIGGEIAIETKLDPEVSHGICDANQLENAILNLAINARDAMPDGGTLTISTGRTRIENEPEVEPGDYICVTVTDTGIGMSSDVLARATEPFFSTKPVGKGTGLGLAQVYGIACQSGGTVRIESEMGKGSSVHLLMPAAKAGAAGAARDGGQALLKDLHSGSAGATVLVIDDDTDVREFLVESIEGLGHKAMSASSGEEGLQLLEEAEPDLLLVDYAMPGMNGADVARHVRESRPDLPIMFVTGYAESEQLEAAAGADVAVLRKPFAISELAAAIERALKREAAEAPLSSPS